MYYSSACKIIRIENWEGEGFITEKSLKKMLVPRGVHRNIFFRIQMICLDIIRDFYDILTALSQNQMASEHDKKHMNALIRSEISEGKTYKKKSVSGGN